MGQCRNARGQLQPRDEPRAHQATAKGPHLGDLPEFATVVAKALDRTGDDGVRDLFTHLLELTHHIDEFLVGVAQVKVRRDRSWLALALVLLSLSGHACSAGWPSGGLGARPPSWSSWPTTGVGGASPACRSSSEALRTISRRTGCSTTGCPAIRSWRSRSGLCSSRSSSRAGATTGRRTSSSTARTPCWPC